MNYEYYSSEKFRLLREKTGYKFIEPYMYLTGYKRRYVKSFLPAIIVESDFKDFAVSSAVINQHKPFYVSGKSFQKINITDFAIEEKGTFIIDLGNPPDNIWNNFDYSLQKQIKKAERLGFMVRKAEIETDLSVYHQLLTNLRTQLGFTTSSLAELKTLWQTLHTPHAETSCYEIFLCFDKNKQPLAGIGVFINSKTKTLIEVGIGRAAGKDSLPAGDFLKWYVLTWVSENRFAFYDLAGVEPNPLPGSKEENIYRYKAKWGGKFYPLYHYEKYFLENRWCYPLTYQLLKWMHFIKK